MSIIKEGELPIDPLVLNWTEFSARYGLVEPDLKGPCRETPKWLNKEMQTQTVITGR